MDSDGRHTVAAQSGQAGVNNHRGEKIRMNSLKPGLFLRHTQALGASVNLPVHEPDHSTPPGAKVKNAWS